MATPEPSVPAAHSFKVWRERFWRQIIATSDSRRRHDLMTATFGLVMIIGVADYLTGFELSLLVFYFIPVCLAVAAAGWRFGVVIAIASVATWLTGDIAAGAHYANPIIPIWNALIALATYLVLVWILASLIGLQREMEERVRQRTAALTQEIAERERLEKAVLEIGERERRSMGHDLHDGLGQHLTGTALVAQALGARLTARQDAEAPEMQKIVALVEQGIEQTRGLAKGLLLAEIERNGLVAALEELAATMRSDFRIDCQLRCEGTVNFNESDTSTHLYRIAQEATRNAVRHGRARHIVMTLSTSGTDLVLQVSDDGSGLPPLAARGQGLGLGIMAHRAAIIGARFTIEAQPQGGTAAMCRLQHPKAPL